MEYVNQDIQMFFQSCPAMYPLFEDLRSELLRRFPDCHCKVQKTQISFSNRHLFACVSFLRVKKKTELPEAFFTLTLGLPTPLASERVAAKTEPYPGRWTTHLIISTPDDLDEELFGWVQQAYDFSQNK